MKLNDIGELGFINRIKAGCFLREKNVIKGIGDDCAVFRISPDMVILLTTDMLVEDIHFRKELIPPDKLGRKSLAVNISDIAAMGGIPREAVISIAIPDSLPVEYLDSLFDGIKAMAREFDVNLLGGDTTASPDRLVINIALVGEAREDEILYRSGAKPGDTIFLTGTVGASAVGLDAILNHRVGERWQNLVEAHINPSPHVSAGRIISGLKVAHSLIDVSDGLASDLGHICEESGVRAIIHQDSIPVIELFMAYILEYKLDFDKMAIHTGEDYILLGTVPSDSAPILRDSLRSHGCGYYPIGEIVEGNGIALKLGDGSLKPINTRGYDHFRKISE